MIAAWMLFTLEVSVLFFAAAWLAERALSAAKRPVRWVWMTAMVATALLPLTAWFAPVPTLAIPDLKASANTTPDSATAMMPGFVPKSGLSSRNKTSNAGALSETHANNSVIATASSDSLRRADATSNTQSTASIAAPIGLSNSEVKSIPRRSAGVSILPASIAQQFEVAPNSAFQRLSSSLLNAWLAIAGIGTLICLLAIARTMRQRGTWSGEYVDGTPVLVTHDVGPALIGVLQYSIVVPRWVFELEGRARKLILAHEREHARSYDPILLALGVFLVVVAPWNVVSWLMLRRLRLAIEMDCDQRVLRAHPDARSYSSLLLDVAERTLPSVMPQAALVEYGTSLETRIRAMISPSVRYRVLRVGGNLLAMGALVAVACVTPRPYASLPPTERVARLRSDLADAEKAVARSDGPKVDPMTMTSDQYEAYLKAQYPRERKQASIHMDLASYRATVVDKPSKLQEPPTSYDPAASFRARLEAQSASSTQSFQARWIGGLVGELEPAKLRKWARGDSALVLLISSERRVISRSTMALSARDMMNQSPLNLLLRMYYLPATSSMNEIEVSLVTEDENGAKLDQPLKVVWATLKSGAAVPRTRRDIIPTREAMIAMLRKTHPEVFTDNSSSPLIGTLLFNTDGELLGTNAIHNSEPRKWPDGQENRDFERTVFRAAFGNLMDGGPIIESGAQSYLTDQSPRDGEWRLMFAVIMKNAAPNTGGGVQLNEGRINMTSVIAYRGAQTPLDANAYDKRIKGIALKNLPSSFASWSRKDSAMFVALDADDQLVVSGAGPIAKNGQLEYVTDLLKSRMPLPPALDFTVVGFTTITARDQAMFDTPLQIVWGRLKRDAQLPNLPYVSAGWSSRSTTPSRVELAQLEARISDYAKSRDPLASSQWSNGDSALVLVFDDNDQLLLQRAGPLTNNAQLQYLATYLNDRFYFINADLFETVGRMRIGSNGTTSSLKQPLQVVWGRLKRDAKIPELVSRPVLNQPVTPSGMISGSSGRGSGVNDSRIRELVLLMADRRAPQVFNNWDRATTSLMLVIDSNNQYLAHGTGPLAQNTQLSHIQSMFGKRQSSLFDTNDIESVGIENFVMDAHGRNLDGALQVVWARLKPGAKLKN